MLVLPPAVIVNVLLMGELVADAPTAGAEGREIKRGIHAFIGRKS